MYAVEPLVASCRSLSNPRIRHEAMGFEPTVSIAGTLQIQPQDAPDRPRGFWAISKITGFDGYPNGPIARLATICAGCCAWEMPTGCLLAFSGRRQPDFRGYRTLMLSGTIQNQSEWTFLGHTMAICHLNPR